jgi:excisionase family DNA binding protein
MVGTPTGPRSRTSRTEWLSVRDIAVLLHVSEGTIRRWIGRGRLKAKFFGGRIGYRISDSALEAFLANGGRVMAASDGTLTAEGGLQK